MELTKKEIKAVKGSIKHWEKDIQKRLLNGEKIDKSDNFDITWKGSGGDEDLDVDCWADSCPLCRLRRSEQNCEKCPYVKKYKVPCHKKHWNSFVNNPDLKTCNAMIKALEKILE